MTIGKTATTPDWREFRGEACVVQAPKCNRPPLQAEPFGAAPYRAFFRVPVLQPQSLASPNVSQALISPLAYPRLNHFTRCAELPCVNDSGVT